MTSAGEGSGRTRVLGIDVGSVRVGLAVSDETCTLASPLATVPNDPRTIWTRIAREMEDRQVERVVVGLPRKLDGSEGDAAESARNFVAELQRHVAAPVEFWDERFTTTIAERSLIESGVRRRRRREVIDAVAAAVLLQSWLDARRLALSRAPT
ncbi:MAG TPA: Holliday junction resolvase RuvX [Candidatus Dormibacteraeota bacterium]